jgi:3-oxoacyl-[acyl-carrier protein] reductase
METMSGKTGESTVQRTVLVTGGSRGIGSAIAARLAEAGMRVLAPGRRELNLSSGASIDAYMASLSGPVDVLVNNAGINHLAAVEEITDETLTEMIQVNMTAPLRLIQVALSGMKRGKFGRIVNVGSIFGIVSKERRLQYTATKAALIGMTKTLAIELGPHNILVNCVAPGYVLTELTRQNNSQEELEKIGRMIPLRRLAEPAEVAELVAFLCSEKNTYITGQTIIVDGGFTCM